MTAVEWLYNIMYKHKGIITISEYEQAKEMEKQQIKEAYLRGIKNYDPTFKSEQDEDSNTTSN
jgi:hypothetical protein